MKLGETASSQPAIPKHVFHDNCRPPSCRLLQSAMCAPGMAQEDALAMLSDSRRLPVRIHHSCDSLPPADLPGHHAIPSILYNLVPVICTCTSLLSLYRTREHYQTSPSRRHPFFHLFHAVPKTLPRLVRLRSRTRSCAGTGIVNSEVLRVRTRLKVRSSLLPRIVSGAKSLGSRLELSTRVNRTGACCPRPTTAASTSSRVVA